MQSRAILSAQNGHVRMRYHLPIYIRMMEDGLLDPETIVTRRYKLDEIDDALQASVDKRDLSGVIVPNG